MLDRSRSSKLPMPWQTVISESEDGRAPHGFRRRRSYPIDCSHTPTDTAARDELDMCSLRYMSIYSVYIGWAWTLATLCLCACPALTCLSSHNYSLPFYDSNPQRSLGREHSYRQPNDVRDYGECYDQALGE
ncbi:hypothetical protein CC78DRAFT_331172 [Lojkania enalia]|uniref:Uncharacterized protein n=1 Tax=Lojkania enalia TaxID=147567 RepID=A0A9P4KGX1_9PLEO|nr:hypothetical protein CC78DRAFT_331172 [Didymosphaeria enalia]